VGRRRISELASVEYGLELAIFSHHLRSSRIQRFRFFYNRVWSNAAATRHNSRVVIFGVFGHRLLASVCHGLSPSCGRLVISAFLNSLAWITKRRASSVQAKITRSTGRPCHGTPACQTALEAISSWIGVACSFACAPRGEYNASGIRASDERKGQSWPEDLNLDLTTPVSISTRDGGRES